VIFFAAVTLGPVPGARGELPRRADELARILEPLPGWLAVSDPWDRLDLSRHGFTSDDHQPWMSRVAGELGPPLASAADFQVMPVTDERTLVEFEAVHNEGFGAPATPPGTYYGRGLLDHARTHLFLARRLSDGAGAGTAMAYVGDDAVGVYGVSVLPALRGRGIGWALTREAVNVAPDRTAVLQPSTEGLSMYRRMGFASFADFAVWVRPETAG
jgi:ribosomal protein S18 acetylase RimI-like enzyme